MEVTAAAAAAAAAAAERTVLDGTNDRYGGIIVDMMGHMPIDSAAFSTLLRTSLSLWAQQGKKGIWIKLPIQLANLVEAAVQEGFWYHHAEPTYLMLVYWIPETAHTIPANASHQIGIGAFVMKDNKEVLVVRENHGRFGGNGVWKFPTGLVDQGEDICAAAVREVKEETGIDTEFVELLAIRQKHEAFHGKSDLLFICMLKPLSFDIVTDNSEIQEATWLPVEEYAQQPFILRHQLFDYIAKICSAKKDNAYTGFSAVPTIGSSSGNKSDLYYNNQDMKLDNNI